MRSVFTATRPSHFRTRVAMNSLTLSLRTWADTPLHTNRFLSRFKTSSLIRFLDRSMARIAVPDYAAIAEPAVRGTESR